ncbi:MAG: hypothetical protein HYZ45_10970 [Burkholderiales bacterium]|nr:hypothetical protein [Burkholderiales bacterium]
MSGSSVLDVAIGMMFIYLLFGILCTAINESIASFINKRGKNLLAGIQNLLNDPASIGLAHQLYHHGLIDGISQNATNENKPNRLPSYLPPTSFSLALVDILATRGALAAAHSRLLLAAEQADDAVNAAVNAADKPPSAEQSKAIELARSAQKSAETALLDAAEQASKAYDEADQTAKAKPNDIGCRNALIQASQQRDLSQAAVKLLQARRAGAGNAASVWITRLGSVPAEEALNAGRKLLTGELDPLHQIELAIAHLPNGHSKESLYVLLEKTRRELNAGEHAFETLRKNLEHWFNEAMDRVSGWYKRWSQTVSFVSALVLVLVCNLDSLALAQRLMNDGALRTSLVTAATGIVQDAQKAQAAQENAARELASKAAASIAPPASGDTPSTGANSAAASSVSVDTASPSPAKTLALSVEEQKKIVNMVAQNPNLPLGWDFSDDAESSANTSSKAPKTAPNAVPSKGANSASSSTSATNTSAASADKAWHWHWSWQVVIAKIIGLAISVFAVSLGAPFWFDLLVKFINMRSSGKRPSGPKEATAK